MIHRLAAIAGRIRRALALLIVGAIAGAIIGELWARARLAWTLAGDFEAAARRLGVGQPRPRAGPDWYAARRLADEAEMRTWAPDRAELVTLTVPPAE